MESRIEGNPSAEDKKNDDDAATNARREELHDSNSTARKLRILCLHGFRTNGRIMEQQIATAKWAPLMDDIAELVFPDAPLPAVMRFPLEEKYGGPFFEWYRHSKNFAKVYHMESSIAYLADFVTVSGPFDGLLGFSQGGIFSGALMGFYANGIGPKILDQFKFLIVVGGGRFLNNSLRDAYSQTIKCPSLHLIGDKDFMKLFGEALMTGCEDPVVIRHPYGHLIPRLSASQGQIVREFLLKQLQFKFPSHEGNDPMIKIASPL
ncbi:unnamed protein product [Calypogeia fissa]